MVTRSGQLHKGYRVGVPAESVGRAVQAYKLEPKGLYESCFINFVFTSGMPPHVFPTHKHGGGAPNNYGGRVGA